MIISAVAGLVRTHRHAGERRVELREDVGGALVDAAEDDPVGVHEVVDRLALGQELRVRAHAEVVSGALARGLLEQRDDDAPPSSRGRRCS